MVAYIQWAIVAYIQWDIQPKAKIENN